MAYPKLNTPPLRALFLDIARATAASSCLAACLTEQLPPTEEPDAGDAPHDAAPDAPPEPSPEDAGADSGGDAAWERVPCGDLAIAKPAGELHTSRPVDYLGVHKDIADGQGGFLPPGDGGVFRFQYEIARSGEPCSGAANLAACEEQFRSVQASSGCQEPVCLFGVEGSAGEHTRIDSRAALLALLGSIDSAAEAVLLAAFDGRHVCPGVRSDPRDIGTEARATASGYELRSTWEHCGEGLFRDHLTVDADGKLSLVSHMQLAPSLCAIGRRPAGLCAGEPGPSQTRIGAFLADAAHLEAASIFAFHQLIRELQALDAPEELTLLALDAMIDEVRHAREVGRLAQRYGAETRPPEVRQTALRSLLEIALDNVSEGCVRETFGALLATYQAESATDLEVRQVMARIAEDETRHAALSWKLMAWLTPQLSEHERAQVEAACAQTRSTLASQLDVALSAEECRTLGLPTREISQTLLDRMYAALWS